MNRYPALVFVIILLASGCSYIHPQSSPGVELRPWVYTDLRALDDADTATPDQDLLAVYLRTAGDEIQIRLDFVDLTIQNKMDLYIAVDTGPGGTRSLPISTSAGIEWDTLIMIPGKGSIQAINSKEQKQHNLAIRVIRDPVLDILTVSLNRSILYGPKSSYRVQVFITPSNSLIASDQSTPVSSEGTPPQKAEVLLAFWDALPAYTPAQALRRWDGAHTGPLGGRHGLYNLLRTAKSHSIPLALLDLKSPLSLSALDYAEGVKLVKDLSARNLLILPEAVPVFPIESPYLLPDWMVSKAAQESRETGLAFGLPASPFLFTFLPMQPTEADSLSQNSYSMIFCPVDTNVPFTLTHINRRGEKKVLYIPVFLRENNRPVQVTPNGFSLEAKRGLIRAALANNSGNGSPSILVLGGDLPETEWGDPISARTAMDYLAAHPWIKILDANDLSSEPITNRQPIPQPPSNTKLPGNLDELMLELKNAPDNELGRAAWQAALALFAPVSPTSPDLPKLRSQYIGGVKALLEASKWAENPMPVAICTETTGPYGESDCIFANQNFYTQILLKDGSLNYAFVITKNGIHQIIGPTSQFASGLGDPTAWDLSQGLSADPTVLLGAFGDGNGPYRARVQGDSLILTGINGTQKSFSLGPDGIKFVIQSEKPSNYQLPLALDPWIRFTPAWAARYNGMQSPDGWIWSVSSTISVKILTSGQISSYAFTDTRDRMGMEEDPNFDYPPGHFLVFPVAVAKIQSQGNFSATIQILPTTGQ